METSLDALQAQLRLVQMENHVLRDILSRHQIAFEQELQQRLHPNEPEPFCPNQGARIRLPPHLSDEMVDLFFRRFRGREDVYAERFLYRDGKSGYAFVCQNIWSPVCRKGKYKGDKGGCSNCPGRVYAKLTPEVVRYHLLGRDPKGKPVVVGVYPLREDGTCHFLVFDLDAVDGANEDDAWQEEVQILRKMCAVNHIQPLVERSRSGRGAHLWLFFSEPVEAYLARRFGAALLERAAKQMNCSTFRYYDRMLPAQNSLPKGGLGNFIALPLQRQPLDAGNTAFVDENGNAYPDQWGTLAAAPALSRDFVQQTVEAWEAEQQAELGDADDQMPAYTADEDDIVEVDGDGNVAQIHASWDRVGAFSKQDAPAGLAVTLFCGIDIDMRSLGASLAQKLRHMAAYPNPQFYKNLAIGRSNYATSSWIYLGEEHPGTLRLPRGLFDPIQQRCQAAGIPLTVTDKRQAGREIRVQFQGQLREKQQAALDTLLQSERGILEAVPGFGKTVVCLALVAARRVNTLILLHTTALLEQWAGAAERFLQLDEEPPSYTTPTGRVKRRPSAVGTLTGQKDTLHGVLDIAMVQSFCKRDLELHARYTDYGMVIVDECHHAAAETLASILLRIPAKYVYGVTATPIRADHMEKSIYMLFGPIRYRYSAKDRVGDVPMGRYVRLRFTRTVATTGSNEKLGIQDAYKLLIQDPLRNAQIVGDVYACLQAGRTPVVLSRSVEHVEKLSQALQGAARHVITLVGKNGGAANAKQIEALKAIPPEESLVIVATQSLIGEGFDFPRLGTLFLATPVSARSVLIQFVGRLDRVYPGKTETVVYDYVDQQIPVFKHMMMKRLRAYKAIGYEMLGDKQSEEDTAPGAYQSIYRPDAYLADYTRDLLAAQKSIILASPVISTQKVDMFIETVRAPQERGVQVSVVTVNADYVKFGNSAVWMQLHDEMRSAGIAVQLLEECNDHYLIVDDKIVWYGSLNFLGKTDTEDNLLRVVSSEVAQELKEITFGKNPPERLQ